MSFIESPRLLKQEDQTTARDSTNEQLQRLLVGHFGPEWTRAAPSRVERHLCRELRNPLRAVQRTRRNTRFRTGFHAPQRPLFLFLRGFTIIPANHVSRVLRVTGSGRVGIWSTLFMVDQLIRKRSQWHGVGSARSSSHVMRKSQQANCQPTTQRLPRSAVREVFDLRGDADLNAGKVFPSA